MTTHRRTTLTSLTNFETTCVLLVSFVSTGVVVMFAEYGLMTVDCINPYMPRTAFLKPTVSFTIA
jgi:hypothetical protein